MLSNLGQCNHGTDFYSAIYQREWWWWDNYLYITTLSPNNVTYHIENSTGAIISSGNVSNDSPATIYSRFGHGAQAVCMCILMMED